MYLYVRHYVWEMCNGGQVGSFFEFGKKDEEKKGDEDHEDDEGNSDEIEDQVVRGCLVMAQPGTNKFLVFNQGGLAVIPGGCGVLGGLIEDGKLGFCKQVLKDPRYDPMVDDVLLGGCGRPIFDMERNAAVRYQSLAMKTSNVMSRTTKSKSRSGVMRRAGDRHGSVVIGMIGSVGGGNLVGSISSISTKVEIPDIGLMVMPIRIGEGPVVGAVVGAGKADLLDETVARNLSLISTAVGGGYVASESQHQETREGL